MPYRQPKPLVLMLAGLPASGKTTLLHEALRDGQALFGNAFRDSFLQLRPPPRDSEHQLTLADRLALGSWINEGDLVTLHLRRQGLPRLVVHFDLLWFLRIGFAMRAGQQAYDTLDGFAAFLADGGLAQATFRQAFTLFPVHGSRLVIRVEKPAYAIVCARSRGREGHAPRPDLEHWNRFLNRHLYDGGPDGERLYERLYADWQQAMADPGGSPPPAHGAAV